MRALEAAANLGRIPRDQDGLPRMTIVPEQGWRMQLLKNVTVGVRDLPSGDTSQGGSGLTAALSVLVGAAASELLTPWLSGRGAGLQTALPYVLTVE